MTPILRGKVDTDLPEWLMGLLAFVYVIAFSWALLLGLFIGLTVSFVCLGFRIGCLIVRGFNRSGV